MVQLDPLVIILIAAGLLALAVIVFNRVRKDYRELGRLSPLVSWIQLGFFVAYACSSYLFLDSRLDAVSATGWLLGAAILLLAVGFVLVLFTMPILGQRSFGHEVGRLNTDGLYRYSRNPQLVGGFLFMLGYALLWPAWQGLLFVGLWLPVSWLMVRGEEEHLQKVFGEDYREYCRRTPRFVGIPDLRRGK